MSSNVGRRHLTSDRSTPAFSFFHSAFAPDSRSEAIAFEPWEQSVASRGVGTTG